MTKLTKEQLSMLEKEAKKVVGMVSEGKNTQEILSEIYVQNLEDKSKEQGDIMAEATIKAISEWSRLLRTKKRSLTVLWQRWMKVKHRLSVVPTGSGSLRRYLQYRVRMKLRKPNISETPMPLP